MSARYAVVNADNIVTNTVIWDGASPWQPIPHQPLNADGLPEGDPVPQTAVPDTDPPTARVGYIYNAADGSFTNPAAPAPATQPGLISRVLSALNPFK